MGAIHKIGDIQIRNEILNDTAVSIYKGYYEPAKCDVWVKLSRSESVRGEKALARFEAECKAFASLKHPNLVPLVVYGAHQGHAYIATEYVPGSTISELIAIGKLPANLAAYAVQEIGKGLKAVHDAGRFHRNLKPSNILVTRDGRIKLTGFSIGPFGGMSGVSERGRLGMAYRSLEIWDGAEVTAASDVFSLGAVLFETITGERAFKGDTLEQIQTQIKNYDPIDALHDEDTLPVQLRRVCQQLLKKRPEQRYQDCSVLLSDLEAYRKARGPAAIGNAADLIRYIHHPEEYKSKLRDKTVTISPRTSKTRAPTKSKAALEESKNVAKGRGESINVVRILGIVAVFVFLFAGLSLAGNFFFSKDGQYGSRKSTPGASGPSKSDSKGVAAARSGGGKGAGTVQVEGAGSESPMNGMPPLGDVKTIVVEGEVIEDEKHQTPDRSAVKPKPASAPPDTVILQSDPQRPRGRLYLDVDPWAYVFLGEDSLGITPLPVTISPGSYRVSFIHPNFPDFDTPVDVLPGRETRVNVSLWSLVGMLRLKTDPGVRVYVDGKGQGVTPLQHPLLVYSGSHQLILEHPDTGFFESTFEIEAGKSLTLQFNLGTSR